MQYPSTYTEALYRKIRGVNKEAFICSQTFQEVVFPECSFCYDLPPKKLILPYKMSQSANLTALDKFLDKNKENIGTGIFYRIIFHKKQYSLNIGRVFQPHVEVV